MYNYLVVGAGLFGAVFAAIMNENGKSCLVIDKRSHVGGNVYQKEEAGIRIHLYGPHIFHTDNEEVWRFINQYGRFNHFINSPLACYKGRLYNLPFNMNTFSQLWNICSPEEAKMIISRQREKYNCILEPSNLEEQALKLCGDDIYHTFIKEYTEKQWGRPARELPADIIKRVPFRFTFDNNYYNDTYQGIPVDGYNEIIKKLLTGRYIQVKTKSDFFNDRYGFERIAEKVLFTGCIDAYFDYRFGQLAYRSLRFEHFHLVTDNYQGNAVVNFNEATTLYTRIIEHKHFEFGQQPTTVITKEYPKEYTQSDEPYYPVNDLINTRRLNEYKTLSANYPHVIFGGRLGAYSYLDMDDTIAEAIALAKKELTHK